MTRRANGRAGWFAAVAALLGTVALLTKVSHVARLRAAVGARYDEASGRGRAATPPTPRAIRAGHEIRDMQGGLMGKLVLLLGAAAVCMIFAMVGLRYWVTQAQRSAYPPFTAAQTTLITPPGPPLQRDPVAELAALDAAQAWRLGSFGYAEDDHSRAHIPIDRAKALTVGQGLGPPP